jgi:hypothetical protein
VLYHKSCDLTNFIKQDLIVVQKLDLCILGQFSEVVFSELEICQRTLQGIDQGIGCDAFLDNGVGFGRLLNN